MDLQQHLRFAVPVASVPVDADHRHLDQVRGRALQRRVHGRPLGEDRALGLRRFMSGIGRSRPSSVLVTPVRRTSSIVSSMNFLTPE